mmetsp:Transcript_4278/g.8239  ORF Transcript_4278/g.8239 Transcript_4278/m.8239 type:complete len:297 (+) Transcript_4278:605-1495(+)
MTVNPPPRILHERTTQHLHRQRAPQTRHGRARLGPRPRRREERRIRIGRPSHQRDVARKPVPRRDRGGYRAERLARRHHRGGQDRIGIRHARPLLEEGAHPRGEFAFADVVSELEAIVPIARDGALLAVVESLVHQRHGYVVRLMTQHLGGSFVVVVVRRQGPFLDPQQQLGQRPRVRSRRVLLGNVPIDQVRDPIRRRAIVAGRNVVVVHARRSRCLESPREEAGGRRPRDADRSDPRERGPPRAQEEGVDGRPPGAGVVVAERGVVPREGGGEYLLVVPFGRRVVLVVAVGRGG